MNYEQKQELLRLVNPEMKDILIARIAAGEQVDITKDADLFFQINRDRMSMEQQMNRDKYVPLAEQMKRLKSNLYDPKYGLGKDKKMRHLGEIPADIYFTHPKFSPNLPKEERDKNIREFLNEFPAFRTGDKQV